MENAKQIMLYTDVIKRFQNGERNFSNARIVGGNFDGLNLEGIVFRNSNLVGPTFRHANLAKADFSNAKLEFCSFFSAKLDNATFKDAKIEASGFAETRLDGTDFDGAELYWVPFVDSNYPKAKLKNAKIIKAAFTWGEVTEEDLIEAIQLFGARAKENLPSGRAMELISGTEAVLEQLKSLRLGYGKGLREGKGYSLGKSLYAGSRSEQEEYANQIKAIVYGLFGDYDLDKKTSKSYKR